MSTDSTWDEVREDNERALYTGNTERAQRARRRFRHLARELGLSPQELKRDLRRGDVPTRRPRPAGWDAWDTNWNKGWSDDDPY